LDKARTALPGKDRRAERGTEIDVTGSYNQVFLSRKRTGARTSLIVDPSDGRLPLQTPEAQKMAAADREYRLALMQATETCKIKYPTCSGGKYEPTPSLRRAESPPRYNTGRMNRRDGPEDGALAERCLTVGLPEFGTVTGSFRRIVQTPGGITMFYDEPLADVSRQMGAPVRDDVTLPALALPDGDSRGHWEGNTLVIDVTNFSPKTDFLGSRENLHLIERWTRTGANSLEYVVTIEDPTVWTRPWTVAQEFSKQSDQENRLYFEPRCTEGNYALPGLLRGARIEELAFVEGRGPDPATKDSATAIDGFEEDPLGPQRVDR
jgi:hypothetical protein